MSTKPAKPVHSVVMYRDSSQAVTELHAAEAAQFTLQVLESRVASHHHGLVGGGGLPCQEHSRQHACGHSCQVVVNLEGLQHDGRFFDMLHQCPAVHLTCTTHIEMHKAPLLRSVAKYPSISQVPTCFACEEEEDGFRFASLQD